MIELSRHTDPNPVLRAWIRDWLVALAEGRIEEACGRLDEPNRYGHTWTEGRIRKLIAGIFGPASRFASQHAAGPVFSHPDHAVGDAHVTVSRFDDGSGFAVDHDVPLNGEWSDLTAQFEFRRRGDELAVVLHDLHVM